MSHVTSKILSGHKALFEHCGRLISLADLCFKRYTSKQKDLEKSRYKNIILGFAGRSFKCFQAICLLCREGFAQDAQMLVRTMLENLINLKWIGKEPERRSLLWEKSGYEDGLKWAREIVEFPNDYWDVKDQVEQDKKDLEKKLENFEGEHPEITQKVPLLIERCRKVNLLYLYHHIFRPYSHMIHGGFGALGSYFQKRAEGTRLDCTPSDKGVDEPLFYAFKCFSLILEEFAEEFGLLTNSESQELRRMLNVKFNTRKSSEEGL